MLRSHNGAEFKSSGFVARVAVSEILDYTKGSDVLNTKSVANLKCSASDFFSYYAFDLI